MVEESGEGVPKIPVESLDRIRGNPVTALREREIISLHTKLTQSQDESITYLLSLPRTGKTQIGMAEKDILETSGHITKYFDLDHTQDFGNIPAIDLEGGETVEYIIVDEALKVEDPAGYIAKLKDKFPRAKFLSIISYNNRTVDFEKVARVQLETSAHFKASKEFILPYAISPNLMPKMVDGILNELAKGGNEDAVAYLKEEKVNKNLNRLVRILSGGHPEMVSQILENIASNLYEEDNIETTRSILGDDEKTSQLAKAGLTNLLILIQRFDDKQNDVLDSSFSDYILSMTQELKDIPTEVRDYAVHFAEANIYLTTNILSPTVHRHFASAQMKSLYSYMLSVVNDNLPNSK
jgi:hypothetical protein